jgi:hypothetical protein
MALLYDEVSPAQRAELTAHLAHCARCDAQMRTWRQSLQALDTWTLPPARRQPRPWSTAVQWAAVAAVVLILGFAWGRMTSPQAAEMRTLRAEVARLSIELPRQHAEDLKRVALAATESASAETVRLLTEFAKASEEQRATDKEALANAIKRIDARFNVLRGEIETVAINTQTTFEQTHQNLTRLAALNLPDAETPTQPEGRP